jgi:Cytochrome oxidase complex assembly protein 1
MSATSPIAAAANAEPQVMSPVLTRWNWGAFLLNWIWGIGNGTPVALLTLVPVCGFVMMFVLGAKGSIWAWHNKRWDSLEHFARVQRRWAIAGVIVWIAGIALFVAIFAGTFAILKHSEAYQMGLAQLQSNASATAALGTPITGGRPNGSISTENANGKASLTFPVSGPKASGTAFVEAIRKDGVWSLTRLAFKLDGSDSVIEIIGPTKNST